MNMPTSEENEKRRLLNALADLALLETEIPVEQPTEKEIAEFMRPVESLSPEEEAVLKSLGPDFMKKIIRGEIKASGQKPFDWKRFGQRLKERLQQAESAQEITEPLSIQESVPPRQGREAKEEQTVILLTRAPKRLSGAAETIKKEGASSHESTKEDSSVIEFPRITTRKFIGDLGKIAATGIAGSVLTGLLKAGEPNNGDLKCVGKLKAASRGGETQELDRHELVRRIFFPGSAPFEVVPAKNRPGAKLIELERGIYTYANELHAIKAIRNLFPHDPTRVLSEAATPDEDNNWVFLGSSVSNEMVKQILGNPTGEPKFEALIKKEGLRVNFDYTVVELDRHAERVQDGEKHYQSPVKVIRDKAHRDVAIPRTPNDKLKSDYLLVSRFPRNRRGRAYLFFSGLHGPAIISIEELLHYIDLADLRYLLGIVQGKAGFQAIFEIAELEPGIGEKGETTVPVRGAVKLLKHNECAPKLVRVTFGESSIR